MAGRLIVVSGPSGVGKTTVCEALLGYPGFRRVVTATSRPPRPGERQGIDYHFLSEADFEAAQGRGEFLETAQVHGHLYGTPRKVVEEGLQENVWLLLNIDVQGARQIRESARKAPLPLQMVFLEPPNIEELARRLRGRGTDGPESMEKRLKTALLELEERPQYDHVVVNNKVPATVKRILKLIGYPGSGRKSTRSIRE